MSLTFSISTGLTCILPNSDPANCCRQAKLGVSCRCRPTSGSATRVHQVGTCCDSATAAEEQQCSRRDCHIWHALAWPACCLLSAG